MIVAALIVSVVFTLGAGARAASAGSFPARNDNYLSSWTVPGLAKIALHRSVAEVSYSLPGTEDTTEATTQSDLFDPDTQGLPLFGGGAEPLTCAGFAYGRTVWYDLRPDVPIEVSLATSGFATAIAFYRYDGGTSQLIRSSGFCRVTSEPTNTLIPPVELRAGGFYTVQLGGLSGPSGFAAGALGFTVNAFPDHDADLVLDGEDDCPFLRGVPRFGGCPPALSPRPSFNYAAVGSVVRLDSVTVGTIPGRATVRVRCRACGFSRTLHVAPSATSVAVPGIAGRRLGPGDKLEIWVTRAATSRDGPGSVYRYGAIGSYISYTNTSGVLDSRVIRCLRPGSLVPRRKCT